MVDAVVWMVEAADDLADTTLPAGWRQQDGFELPPAPWDLASERLACVGEVRTKADCQAALEALARGASLAICVTANGVNRQRFLEDLHKVTAPVPYEPPEAPQLSDLQASLLHALAAGATVTSAASQLHVSRRTANRMLSEIRQILGVDTTAAAISRWSAHPDHR